LKHKFTEESIQWAEMDAGGGGTLALKTRGNPQVCFAVTDMDGEMKRLSARGVIDLSPGRWGYHRECQDELP
jgi:hypothetical protein